MAAIETDLPVAHISGRERILVEARTLFTAQGYAAVSMQQIADAASINKATLYHHFRDKEDLFVSVMGDEFGRMTSSVGVAIAEGGSLREQLTRVAAHVFSSSQSDFGRLAADMHAHVSEQRRSELMARSTPPWEQIREAVDHAMQAGEVRDVDADLVSRLFFAMVRSQIWWSRFATTYSEPNDRLAGMIADLLIDGIGVRNLKPVSGSADENLSSRP